MPIKLIVMYQKRYFKIIHKIIGLAMFYEKTRSHISTLTLEKNNKKYKTFLNFFL